MQPCFFWIGEHSEIYVAESIEQLAASDDCGTGIGRYTDDFNGIGVREVLLFGDDDEPLEWGEFDPITTRMTVRNCDENERHLETLTGNLHDIYAWVDGGRHGLPVMLLTGYN